jgi:hypothetical protein
MNKDFDGAAKTGFGTDFAASKIISTPCGLSRNDGPRRVIGD